MTEPLPVPVARAIDAVNAGDTDAFLSAFASDGWIDDNGWRLFGRGEMRGWGDRELIGVNSRFAVTGSESTTALSPSILRLPQTASACSRFAFEVDGASLRSMTITA